MLTEKDKKVLAVVDEFNFANCDQVMAMRDIIDRLLKVNEKCKQQRDAIHSVHTGDFSPSFISTMNKELEDIMGGRG